MCLVFFVVSLSTCVTTGVQLFFQGKLKRELLNCPIKRGDAWLALSAYSASWLAMGLSWPTIHMQCGTNIRPYLSDQF